MEDRETKAAAAATAVTCEPRMPTGAADGLLKAFVGSADKDEFDANRPDCHARTYAELAAITATPRGLAQPSAGKAQRPGGIRTWTIATRRYAPARFVQEEVREDATRTMCSTS